MTTAVPQERELILEMLRADAVASRAEHERALQHTQVRGSYHWPRWRSLR